MKKFRLSICVLLAVVICLLIAAPTTAFAESKKVYVGGFPIGISIDAGGLLVESVTGVETEYGTAYVDGLCRGDIIKKIGGKDVNTTADIQNLSATQTEIEVIRKGERIVFSITPVCEAYTEIPRLGVKVKEAVYGIGTVTFVGADGRYTALGHEIYDADTDTHIPFSGGKIHACKILGIKRGEKGEAGAILASLRPDVVYGTIDCNNNFGIAGEFTERDRAETGELVDVASRDEVKPGSAKIRTTVDGKPEYYDIEIIKAAKHHARKEKGLIFRVTDKKLLQLTGGVVRGMSGSPIIQNGKLVGAVTHVILNDFTKGYGVYADCLN